MPPTLPLPPYFAELRTDGWVVVDRRTGNPVRCEDRGAAVELAAMLNGIDRLFNDRKEAS